jgi:aconitase A
LLLLLCVSGVQVIKVAFPVYYGARYQCQKVPQHVFLKGIQQLESEKQQKLQHAKQQQEQAMQIAMTAALCTGCRETVLQRRSCAAEVAAAADIGAAGQPALVM